MLAWVGMSTATNPAIHDCRGLAVGSKISIIYGSGEIVVTTIERPREQDGDPDRDRLVTTSGTLRWSLYDSPSWWPRLLPGEPPTALRAFDVVSVSPYPAVDLDDGKPPRTHGTFEVVDGVPTVWVQLHGPKGPLVPVRRSHAPGVKP
jgi:hypothetical protein